MPMRIVNLKGGGGPAPAPSGSNGGLFSLNRYANFENANPSPDKFIQLWESGNKAKPRPKTVTIIMWGPRCWHRNGFIDTTHPPDCGSAFGIVTLREEDIPERIYAFRGAHQSGATYTYPIERTFGFSRNLSRTGAWLLPNMGANHYFTDNDFPAADAVNHHWGDFDVIYNGGDGHFFPITGALTHDSPGSNGSPFGAGITSTSQYPASCGGSGTSTARGPKADGIQDDILTPLGSLRPYASEIEPEQDKLNLWGGAGGFEFVLPSGLFGMENGVPYTTDVTKVRIEGGIAPRQRNYTVGDIYTNYIYVLSEYAS